MEGLCFKLPKSVKVNELLWNLNYLMLISPAIAAICQSEQVLSRTNLNFDGAERKISEWEIWLTGFVRANRRLLRWALKWTLLYAALDLYPHFSSLSLIGCPSQARGLSRRWAGLLCSQPGLLSLTLCTANCLKNKPWQTECLEQSKAELWALRDYLHQHQSTLNDLMLISPVIAPIYQISPPFFALRLPLLRS